mmetsp:Transcript_7088/g.10160  ORF Transcript_7088/g.10160 Transcript_7088/m.10160 type:complete len:197 (-) Transcript_7088:243-833(-)
MPRPPSTITMISYKETNESNTVTSRSTDSVIPTADLCDYFFKSPQRLSICEPNMLQNFGKKEAFSGQIETIRCFESNPLVGEIIAEKGNNRVLVIDAGGSNRCAVLGDKLVAMAWRNGWAGIIVNGYIRDSKMIKSIKVGVKALGTHPLKSSKVYKGEKGCSVSFAGVEFVPGHWLYSDEDGVIVSECELSPSVDA